MRILVTGAAGFIGSHLTERLLADGHDVVALDALDPLLYDAETKRANAAAFADRLLVGDVCDRALVVSAARGCDLVVHLAALAGVRPSIAEPARYVRANVEGTVSVLEACRANDVRRLVFASSSSVYGARSPADVPFREDDPCLRPASPYAATKRAGELLASTYRDLFGIGTLALRYFTVYGPRQRPEMAIHAFARALAAGRPVPLFGDGTSARDYTYIDDIVDGTVAACHAVAEGAYEIVNLGGERTTTLSRLVELLAAALDVPARTSAAPDQPGDVPITCASLEKARRLLAYDPKVSIEDGLVRFVAWLRARR